MGYKADFHIHSYYSDGTMKPTDIVKMYKEREYGVIALTDHDGVDGVKEAMIAGEALEMQVVPGIELAADAELDGITTEIHILGYYFDIENKELNDKLAELREARKRRNEKLLAHINDLGYELTEDDLKQRPGQTYIGKPNFARAIKAKGYEIENLQEVLDSVEKEKISAEEAIALIKGAGGIAVLAHPMKIKHIGEPRSEEFWNNFDALLRKLKKTGLKGLECYHPSATNDDSLELVTYAGRYHLHITEGSDFHGDK